MVKKTKSSKKESKEINSLNKIVEKRKLSDLPIQQILKDSGDLYVCGQNDLGQCGFDDEIERKRPTINTSIKNVVDISAGGLHSLCLNKHGEVYSFGCNDEGALGRDTTENGEGPENIPNKVHLPGKCVKISAGDSHSAFLLEDGRVFACGSFRNSHGSMGLTLEGRKGLPIQLLPDEKCSDIASGADHLVILTCKYKIYTIGCAEQGQLGRIALRSASGESRRGNIDILTPKLVTIQRAKFIRGIWATNFCSFVQEFSISNTSSKIYAFGLNNWSQLGMKSTDAPVSRPLPTDLENVDSIVGGQHHTLILKKNKKCYGIGRYTYGCLGIGKQSKDIFENFEEITSLSDKNVISIACGDSQSFAVTNSGQLYSWGMGTNFQLGTGSDEDAFEPTLVTSKSTSDKKFLKVSSGGQHTLFLLQNESDFKQTESRRAINFTNENELCNGNIERSQQVSDKENKIENLNQAKVTKKRKYNDHGTVEANKTSEESNKTNEVEEENAATKRGRKNKN